MTSWPKITAFLLLLLWLPATQYSGLEAAGFEAFVHDDDGSPLCQQGCSVDLCHTTGALSLTASGGDARVLPPPLLALCRCLARVVERSQEPADPDATYGEGRPVLLVLHRSWSFVHRAALPARAPDFAA